MKACSGMEPNLWFPSSAYDTNSKSSETKRFSLNADNKEAIRICFTCDERVECLADNILVKYGIFGGRVIGERVALRVAMLEAGLYRLTGPGAQPTRETRWQAPTAKQRKFVEMAPVEEFVGWLYENETSVLISKKAA